MYVSVPKRTAHQDMDEAITMGFVLRIQLKR